MNSQTSEPLKVIRLSTISKAVSLCLITIVPTESATAKTIRVPAEYNTIQSAIDAAKGGDTIFVSPGVYHESIALKDNITLRSDGNHQQGKVGLARAEATIIDASGKKAPGVLMAPGAVLDGFTVTGVGNYDEEKWKEHHASQGRHQSHEHIGAPGTPGIQVSAATCVVRHNIVHHIGYTGIAIEGSGASPHVHHNVCYRNMGGGIGSMNKSAANIEHNVCFENFYAGIGNDDASPTITNNRCYHNIRAGIGISHGSCPIVRNNQCYENRRAGIGTRTGSNTRPVIQNNDCYGNHMAGIGSEEESAPLIQGNRCYQNKLAGIGSRTGTTPTIIGNECYENEKVGIGNQSNATTILLKNHCHHNKAAGIGFDPCSAGSSIVSGNRVVDNALVAIGIHEGWTVRLVGNQLSRNAGMPPIVMVFAGAQATLVDNEMTGSGVAGIRVAGTVIIDNNRIVGTNMRPAGPPNFGIWALPDANVTATNNQIKGWRHGLHADQSTVTASANTISEFHRAAIVVSRPQTPTNVLSNTAVTGADDAAILLLDGDAGMIRDNKVTNQDQR